MLRFFNIACWCIFAFALLSGSALWLRGQQSAAGSNPTAFKVQSRLVLVPVNVTDSKGGVISGLPRASFSVLENKKEQRIRSFSEQDVPAAVGFVFDLSGSMKISLDNARTAFRALLDKSNPQDVGFLFTVSDRPSQVVRFTGDLSSLNAPLLSSRAKGSTALIDTVWESLQEIKKAKYERKALVVLSDGMDNNSRYNKAELLSEAMEIGAPIFAISWETAQGGLKPPQFQEQRNGLSLLAELSDQTGGLSFVVRDQHGIEQAVEKVGRAIRSEYVIGYVPVGVMARTGSRRSIRVKVNARGLRVHARSGYFLN